MRSAPLRGTVLLAVLATLLPLGACAQAGSQAAGPRSFQRADTAALRHTLDSLVDVHHGTVGYAVMDLDTGERLSRRGDEPFPTASLIKVPVLVTVYDLAEHDSLSLDDPVSMLALDQVGGSGTLQFMRTPMTLHVADLAWLMMTTPPRTSCWTG